MTLDRRTALTALSSTDTSPWHDDCMRVLEAIRAQRPDALAALLRGIDDRHAFFTTHETELSQAILDHDHNADCLAVMLKMGLHVTMYWLNRFQATVHVTQRQAFQELTNKSHMLKRWVRESEHFRKKFGYKIRSLF